MERHLQFGDRKAVMISRQRCMYSGTPFSCGCLPPVPPQTLPSREEKHTQVFIDFARHDQHCRPANYRKLIWVTIIRQSCQILSTLDDSAIYSGIYVQENEDRKENLCCVIMTNTFLFNHLGKKILLLRISVSAFLSGWS